MIVCLNGRFLTETEARVSVFDRSFLYGDGLFETLRLYGGVPFAWGRHLDRLRIGAEHLRIPLAAEADLRVQAEELVKRHGTKEGALRIHVSRGNGPRGYASRGSGPPLTLLTIGPAPADDPAPPRSLSLVTARHRLLSGRDWAFCKSANRLPQIASTDEANRAGADEALMLNERGEVAEAAGANFFWIDSGVVCTPPLDSGALAGVTRGCVLELAGSQGFAVEERMLEERDLGQVKVAFLTSSIQELQWIHALNGRSLVGRGEVEALHRAYRCQVAKECGSESKG